MNDSKYSVLFIFVKDHLHEFLSHKHITSLLSLPSTLYLSVTSPVAGQAHQGSKTKPSGFSGPYAAPTLNNRPGETTLSRSQSQHCSLLIPALCLSLTGHRPFKKYFSNLKPHRVLPV